MGKPAAEGQTPPQKEKGKNVRGNSAKGSFVVGKSREKRNRKPHEENSLQKNPITLLLRKSRKKKFHVKKNFSAFSTNSLANSLNRNIYIPTGMYIIYNESTKMKELVKKIGELSIPLIVGIVAALAWANIDSYSYNDFIYRELAPGVNFHFLVNDVFLVLFFGSVSIEIVHGVAPGGNLYPIKNTVSNLLAAFFCRLPFSFHSTLFSVRRTITTAGRFRRRPTWPYRFFLRK